MDVRVVTRHHLFTAAEPFTLGPPAEVGTVHHVIRFHRRQVMGRRYMRYVVAVDGVEFTLSPPHCERT